MNDGWLEHDGKGVPPDAKPGVTMVKVEYSDGDVRTHVCGQDVEPWDWSNFGQSVPGSEGERGWTWAKFIAYRNSSTDTAVEALKAIAADPKRKLRDAAET